MEKIDRQELIKVISDFIEKGHVENIVAMFKQDQSCYALTGELIRDERFMVRMGVAVLFEELAAVRPPAELDLAVPSLKRQFGDETPYIRGEAANILAIINSEKSLSALGLLEDDPDPQVAEIVKDALYHP